MLFGGLNGTGKTTLMDALQLCLLGSAAKCAGRNGNDYKDFLARSIHKHSRWKQASIEVIFRCLVDGLETRYRVTRAWQHSGNNVKERLEVTRDKRPDKPLTENWAQYVNEIIPANIAHLFFFDGEKIETYASPDGARELVATGIRNLFGMDVVERLQKDIRTLERRRQGMTMLAPDKDVIRQKENELGVLRKHIERMVEEKAILQTRKLDVARRNLARIMEEYQSLGGELRERREEIERRVHKAKTSMEICHTHMMDLVNSELPTILARTLLQDVIHYASTDQETLHARSMVANLRQRDAKVLRLARRLAGTSDIVEVLRDFFRADRKTQEQLAARQTRLNMSDESRTRFETFLQNGMTGLETRVKEVLEEHRRLEDEMEAALLEKASIPPEETIDAVVKERDALTSTIEQLEKESVNIDAELERKRQESNRLEAEINALWEKNAEAELSRKDVLRFTQHAQLARQTMTEFQAAVLHRQIRRVEHLALESYQSLLHKDRLISELSINPETFDIVLRDMERVPICPEQLSAGERQLLAVSLLWGMAKASGRLLPVAIDTPMGRLDSTHRAHLVDRYFPFASHQALLFTTDEEIAGEYLNRLRPWVGRSYRLDYDDATNATTVSAGYWEGV